MSNIKKQIFFFLFVSFHLAHISSDLIDCTTDNQLDFLFFSDTHIPPNENFENLMADVASNNITFDAILIAGDLTNFQAEWQYDVEKNVESINNITLLLNLLSEKISFNKPIFWVPGNHDAWDLFLPSNATFNTFQLTNTSFNVHNRTVEICEKNGISLYITGIGGSTNSTNYQNITAWPGFPWTEQEPYQELMFDLMEQIPSQAQTIFLSHVGPADSSTTLVTGWDTESMDDINVRAPEDYIFSGSSAIRNCISDIDTQKKLIANVHGHTHQSMGQASIGRTRILNGGSVQWTNSYGIVTVALSQAPCANNTCEWQVVKSKFRRYGQGFTSTEECAEAQAQVVSNDNSNQDAIFWVLVAIFGALSANIFLIVAGTVYIVRKMKKYQEIPDQSQA